MKNWSYSLLNILGLSIGIASSLLIAGYVIHETNYDNFYKETDRLYRVNMTNIWMPGGGVMSSSVPPLALVLSSDYPEIEETLRIRTYPNELLRVEDDTNLISYYEDDMLSADSNFFSFFDFELLYGDPTTALKGVDKVVISEEMANKYFRTTDALGKTILLGKDRLPLVVTGVTAPQPTNAHFNFDFLLSIYTDNTVKNVEDNWIWTQVVTYAKLKEGTDPAGLESKLSGIGKKHAAPILERWGINYDEFLADKGDWLFYLQPVKDIHLKSVGIGNRLGTVSDGSYMYIFSFTALFILLLAIINFVNLSTARASVRAKEIGIRKVLGTKKHQLIVQFLFESIAFCLIAGLIGLGLTEFLKILIENYMGATLNTVDGISFLPAIAVFILVVGLFAGLYPAFYLTSFNPSKVLKGQLNTGQKSKWFRNSLVVLQFSISSALMICTFIVFQQLNYFNNKDLGYDKENIIVVNWAQKLDTHLEKFQNEVLNHPDVINASVSMDVIGRGSYEDIFGDVASGQEQPIAMMKADERQLETMGIELLMGRYFQEGNKADENAVVINESTMKLFGYTEDDVLTQNIFYGGDDMGPAKVIGVVRDFNFYSLHSPIAPYLFYSIDAPIWGDSRVLSVKTKEGNSKELLSFLEAKWNEMVDDAPFEYSFLDKEYENQYREEQQLGALFAIFTSIAIFIACLGLFGLASFITHQRTKEIGIRKVLGASINNILIQLSSGFGKLVLISLMIGFPLAWYAMNSWLDQFIYRINIDWWVFAIIGVSVLFLAFATVSFHSIKTAIVNPVDSLRDE